MAKKPRKHPKKEARVAAAIYASEQRALKGVFDDLLLPEKKKDEKKKDEKKKDKKKTRQP